MLALLAGLLLPGLAPGWSMDGHRVIAALAWQRLDPATREAAARLLAAHPDLERGIDAHLPAGLAPGEQGRLRFLEAAAWPDHARDYRETDPERFERYNRSYWHWVNEVLWVSEEARRRLGDRVSTNTATAAPRRARRDMNVLQAIAWNRRTLAREGAAESERALALSWLLHLLADLHQPLHGVALFGIPALGTEGDRGGNLLCLALPAWGPNLHSFWDRALVVGLGGGEVTAMGARLGGIPAGDLGPVTAPDSAVGWWRESVSLAGEVVYPASLRAAAAREVDGRPCMEPEAGRVALGSDYLLRAKLVAVERGAQAALRTAILLESLLGEN